MDALYVLHQMVLLRQRHDYTSCCAKMGWPPAAANDLRAWWRHAQHGWLTANVHICRVHLALHHEMRYGSCAAPAGISAGIINVTRPSLSNGSPDSKPTSDKGCGGVASTANISLTKIHGSAEALHCTEQELPRCSAKSSLKVPWTGRRLLRQVAPEKQLTFLWLWRGSQSPRAPSRDCPCLSRDARDGLGCARLSVPACKSLSRTSRRRTQALEEPLSRTESHGITQPSTATQGNRRCPMGP